MRYLGILGLFMLIVGCSSDEGTLLPNASPQEAILGSWRREDGRGVEKFTREGFKIPAPEFAVSCYTITNDTITYQYGPSHNNDSITYPYKMEGNTLTITAPQATIVLKRVNFDATLTEGDKERVEANHLKCP